MRKERKTKKGKKEWEKRNDGGKLRQYICKAKLLLLSLDIVSVAVDVTYLCLCIRVRGVCPCVVSACLEIRDFYICLLRLASACFSRDFVNRKSNRRLFEFNALQPQLFVMNNKSLEKVYVTDNN